MFQLEQACSIPNRVPLGNDFKHLGHVGAGDCSKRYMGVPIRTARGGSRDPGEGLDGLARAMQYTVPTDTSRQAAHRETRDHDPTRADHRADLPHPMRDSGFHERGWLGHLATDTRVFSPSDKRTGSCSHRSGCHDRGCPRRCGSPRQLRDAGRGRRLQRLDGAGSRSGRGLSHPLGVIGPYRHPVAVVPIGQSDPHRPPSEEPRP